MTSNDLLARTFVDMADTLVQDFDIVDFLHTLTRRCGPLLDTVAAGVMLADHGHGLRVVAASDEQIHLLELFEIQNEQGPCLDAYQSGSSVQAMLPDATARWPAFAPEALEAGYQSVCAIAMRLRGNHIGALNLFRAEARPFTADEVATAQALADVATIGLLQERELREVRELAEQLQFALDSRVTLEQAKGVLAERTQVDMDQAFRLLRGYARQHNLRLTEVAAAVIVGDLVIPYEPD